MSDGQLTREFWAFQQRTTPVCEALEQVGAGDVAFAFVAKNTERRGVRVARTADPSPVAESDYAAVVPDWCGLTFIPSMLSARQADEVMELILRNLDWAAERGVHIHSWSRPGLEPRHGEPVHGGPVRIRYDAADTLNAEVVDCFNLFGHESVEWIAGGPVMLYQRTT